MSEDVQALGLPDTLLIAGCGLLGTSVARAWQQANPGAQIFGIEPDAGARERASQLGVYARVVAELSQLELAQPATVGIAATPPLALADAVTALCGQCELVMDVGSIKSAVIDAFGGAAPEHFVPCHPMAGSHRSGPDAGDADLFGQRWVFVVPLANTRSGAVSQAHQFWQSLGARTREIEPSAHDRAVAYTSHLPHLLASAYMALETPDAAAAGTGFMEFTRLAKANPEMWSQVLSTNQSAWRGLLQNYIQQLTELDALIAAGDVPAVMAYLDKQRAARDALDEDDCEAGAHV